MENELTAVGLAQSIERLSDKREVVCSIPGIGIIPEGLKKNWKNEGPAFVLKALAQMTK